MLAGLLSSAGVVGYLGRTAYSVLDFVPPEYPGSW